ncbi:MAG: alkane 1-monooxygenase [Rhodobacteraceae bacterium]|nr:alkane 1-monooxygenase [Paracoccaceae bacterium]
MTEAETIARPANALPFWMSLSFVPLIALALFLGGWWLILIPLYTWGLFALLDRIAGLNLENADPDTPEADLFWYRLITLIWLPVQAVIVFGGIWIATRTDWFQGWELALMFFGIGVSTGTVGINYSHELMHQTNRLERWLADLLLAMVLYSHFRSEHLLVHHAYVGTPRDPVTARYNESFHRFFPRVLWQCLHSAWRAEAARLNRADRPASDRANPFWRYAILQALMLSLAFAIGGGLGVVLFVWQALVAIWQLELVNYVEHYGLTRKHLGDGRYEPVRPRHSWNSAHRASNWLLINLQRHSDHHYKPNRRFPLLQNHNQDAAPQLPHGYPVMTVLALSPFLWRRFMNPRVRKWRAMYYPEIIDWSEYKSGKLPLPKGAS